MVTLIQRIMANRFVDEILAQTLLDDVLYLIGREKFTFIQEIIFPILNSENVQYQPVCLHTSNNSVGELVHFRARMQEYFKQNTAI